MADPQPDPPDDTARARMEAMIAALHRTRASEDLAQAPTLPASPDDDRLAAIAWRAVNEALQSETGQEHERGAAAPTRLEGGAKVGRYVVLRELGAGGMGVVYAAYDPELDRKVALKLVAPGRAGDDGSTRLLREARRGARVDAAHRRGAVAAGRAAESDG